jgi:hypothetical protein
LRNLKTCMMFHRRVTVNLIQNYDEDPYAR